MMQQNNFERQKGKKVFFSFKGRSSSFDNKKRKAILSIERKREKEREKNRKREREKNNARERERK
jgi:hypothetical protein